MLIQLRTKIMPIIHISIAKGRSLDQKRTLARKLTDVTAETLGVDPEKIWIRIDEFEKENFSVNGELMCDRG
ncbi:MAG: 4-oxalocrotonate tautomerase family protein [Desulfobacteraceae bacterium]